LFGGQNAKDEVKFFFRRSLCPSAPLALVPPVEIVMRNAKRVVFWSLASLCLLPLTGCPKEPTRVSMVMNAAANVNPGANGQPLSVVVRVYQLKDKGRLESADYNAVWKSDKETLSDDLLERQERTLEPGTQDTLEIRANPAANYIGAVALFRNPQGDSWRRVIAVGKGKTQKVNLSLQEQNIVLTSSGK